MALPLVARRAAEALKERLMERLGPRLLEVRVFGSVARGEAGPESDLDVLVLVDERDLDLDNTVYRAAYHVYVELDCPFVIAPLVMSRERMEHLRQRERLLARDLQREGIVV